MNNSLPNVLKKLTSAKILGDDFVALDHRDKGPVYTIFGVANNAEADSSQYGPYMKLFGNFEAVRVSDGARFVSGTAILPEPVGTMIGSQIMSVLDAEKGAEKKDGEGSKARPAARFAFEISVKTTKKGAGYEWICTPVVETSGVDPLADMRNQVAARLPAPAAVAAPVSDAPVADAKLEDPKKSGKK